MIIEIVQRIGEAPLRLDASQIAILNDQGTYLVIAANYGAENGVAIGSVAHDADQFHRMLRNLGIAATTIVEGTIRTPQPPTGAKLLVGPST